MNERTLRMTLAYDGTNYCGWQVQPNGVAVQAVVEQALADFTGERIRVVASGRTDAGVHAIGQVVSFCTRSTAPCRGFLHGLPIHLPDDVVVREVEEAPAGFNARYDARRKWYRYVIHNSPVRTPFLRSFSFWQRSRLDETAMHAAVQHLVGTHDFRCFETQWPNRSSSVRTVFHASVTRQAEWPVWGDRDPLPEFGLSVSALHLNAPPPEIATLSQSNTSRDGVSQSVILPSERNSIDKPFLCFDIEADGFLYNMVRAVAGTLIHVGRGRWSPQDMLRILETGDRTHAGETAPPQGLFLMRVNYDDLTSKS